MNRHRSHPLVAWLCAGAVALIVYGTLYPFDFAPGPTPTLWQALSELSWARAGRGDRIINVLLYVPLGFCITVWLEGRARGREAVVVATLCGAILSLSIEVAQAYVAYRVPSLLDFTYNTAGAFGGALGGVAWRALTARLPTAASGLQSGRFDRGALIVLCLWIATHWAPFIPHFTLIKLKAALQPLYDPQASLSAAVHYVVWWVVIAQVVFALTSVQRGVETLLAVIAIVLVGRLFVIDQTFVASELIALVALLPLLVLLHRLVPPTRRVIVLGAFAAIFVVDRLSPFSMAGGAAHFDLWPFIAWYKAGLPVDVPPLLKQIFEFAALAWLLHEAGASWRSIVAVVPATALGLEVVALWMPGRGGSITAPVIAILICVAMRLASEPKSRPDFTRQRVRSH
ncbi:MAG TPA: VanZ family protein [Steroidobacteraceae bacterium]|nr:VanZ family protein [Steroidobacteraceae bacterium]